MENAVQNDLGEQVYVTAAYPTGLTLQQYYVLTEQERREHTWRPMVLGWPDVVARESASHEWKPRGGD